MIKVLYRKYRSRTLDEVVGQDHIANTLKSALANDKLAHAYLFVGPRGVGKTSVARILAFEANKAKYSDDGHVDIIEIDAASNRRIDEIRELRDKIHISPTELNYKVYIIDEVHMLTREAFNALLKTLEEPPEHAIFILATTESHKVPDTIVSRTQRFVFRPITEVDMTKHLKSIAKKEKIQTDDEALSLIVEHSSGSFRDSISLLDQLSAHGKKVDHALVSQFLGYGTDEEVTALLRASLDGDIQTVTGTITDLLASGAQPIGISSQLIQKLRQEETTDQTLKLIDNLLQVSNSTSPHIKLETELLKVAVSGTSSQIKSVTSKPKHIPKAVNATKEPEVAPKEEKSVKEITEDEIKDLKELSEEDWSKVLLSVKQENYPVYAVLRMALVEANAKTMRLTFPFKFHARRFEEQKFMTIVRNGVGDILPKIQSIIVDIDESVKPTSGEVTEDIITEEVVSEKKDKDTKVRGVLDAFGGGEVVEL